MAPDPPKPEKRALHFSLRDMCLVAVGFSVLLFTLSWVEKSTDVEFPVLFFAIYSLPVVSGMGGLLIGQFRGDIIGAITGGILLAIIVQFIQ